MTRKQGANDRREQGWMGYQEKNSEMRDEKEAKVAGAAWACGVKGKT